MGKGMVGDGVGYIVVDSEADFVGWWWCRLCGRLEVDFVEDSGLDFVEDSEVDFVVDGGVRNVSWSSVIHLLLLHDIKLFSN